MVKKPAFLRYVKFKLAAMRLVPYMKPTINANKKCLRVFFPLHVLEKNINPVIVNQFNIECSHLNENILNIRQEYFQLSADTQEYFKLGIDR